MLIAFFKLRTKLNKKNKTMSYEHTSAEVYKVLRIGSVVRSISVYSNCEDERLDYRKNYVFHHFVSKRKALIEDKESGELMEVNYRNFYFS